MSARSSKPYPIVHRPVRRCAVVGGFVAAGLLAVAWLVGCGIKLGPRVPEQDGEGQACTDAMDCPQPDNICLLAYCEKQQCIYVYSPEGSLPGDWQVDGDCTHLYCDGAGETVGYAAAYDLPADDGNPCTEAACADDKPKSEPKAAGDECGDGGLCNGTGKCGVCLPDVKRCDEHATQSCNADGQWDAPVACEAANPVCNDSRCVGIDELAVGRAHGCALFEDGTVRCWGADDRGQLGTRGLSAATRPRWALGFDSVAVGSGHACGIEQSGSVWCWGAGDYGQLGDDTYESAASPKPVAVADVGEVAVGRQHSCARTNDGAVQCWGRNDRGQLGSGKLAKAPAPVPARRAGGASGRARPQLVGGLKGAEELVLDAGHSCVAVAGGQGLRCWGLAGFPLPPAPDGPEEKARKAICAATPQVVSGLAGAEQLAAGADFSCALLEDGTVHCWGANDRGQLGDGTKQDRSQPAAVTNLSDASEIALGDAFGCALSSDEAVHCWGANDRGQLGRGQSGPTATAGPVTGLSGVEALSVGRSFACALQADGQIMCWGAGRSGQLGNGATDDAPAPVAVRW